MTYITYRTYILASSIFHFSFLAVRIYIPLFTLQKTDLI